MKKLTTYVHAVERLEDGSIGRQGQFGPDDVVPGWARAAITNPDVWDQADHDDAGDVEVDVGARPVGAGRELGERPRGNASRDEWAAYATSVGVKVADDMGQRAIIAAVDEQQKG